MATITLIGPGAIGLTVGMALLSAGHDVTFVAREPFDMLSVTMSDGEVRQRPTTSRVPSMLNVPETGLTQRRITA